MKKTAFIFVITWLFSLVIVAQSGSQRYYIGSGQSSLFLQSYETPESEKFNAKYLNNDWKIGVLQTNSSTIITDVAFHYNVTKDKFEMRADVNPDIVDRINFDGRIFIYTSFINQFGSEDAGYFELQSEGYAMLLSRYSIVHKAAKKGAYGHEAYQNIVRDTYVKVGNNPAVILEKKKEDLLAALPDHDEEVQKFIKKNRLNLSRTSDIIELLQYYSSFFVDEESEGEDMQGEG